MIICTLIVLSLLSVFFLAFPEETGEKYIADIYQNGTLIQSIPLYEITTPQTFVIQGESGCTNEIQACHDSIAILSADCPDKLCVKQGHITNSKLPITCLPNRLVIQLRAVDTGDADSITHDIITY